MCEQVLHVFGVLQILRVHVVLHVAENERFHGSGPADEFERYRGTGRYFFDTDRSGAQQGSPHTLDFITHALNVTVEDAGRCPMKPPMPRDVDHAGIGDDPRVEKVVEERPQPPHRKNDREAGKHDEQRPRRL